MVASWELTVLDDLASVFFSLKETPTRHADGIDKDSDRGDLEDRLFQYGREMDTPNEGIQPSIGRGIYHATSKDAN